jgi:hypothetical protein
VHRVASGRAQALVVECIDLEGPVSYPTIFDGVDCHALVLEAGQVDLREALRPHVYSKWLALGPQAVGLMCGDPVPSGALFSKGTVAEVLPMITGILEAVQAIFRAGLVWRDAKPEVGALVGPLSTCQLYREPQLAPWCGVIWQNFVNFPQEVAGGLILPRWKAVDLASAVERGAALDNKVGRIERG